MLVQTAAASLDRDVRFGDGQQPHSSRYPFYVRGPGAWPALTQRVAALQPRPDRIALVADTGVPEHLARAARDCLAAAAAPAAARDDRVIFLPVAPREDAKTPAGVGVIRDAVTGAGATRRTVVVALGGGLVGNLAGMAARDIFRGTRLVHVPTTPLAASDSTLSGKQAVNGPFGKNHYGCYHWPELVWVDLAFLDGVPELWRHALCELIKNVVAILPGQQGWAEWAGARLRPEADYSHAEMVEFIGLCIGTKTSIMAEDPTECRDARALEYGHTVGHAIELFTHGAISHGFAIGLGMLAEAQVAVNAGYLSPAAADLHRALLVANGAPTTLPAEVPTSELVAIIRHDNKRGYPDAPEPHPDYADLVLLDGIGQLHRGPGGCVLTQQPLTAIAAAIDQALRPGGTP